MNFDLSDEQKMLVETVASFAKKQSPTTRFRDLRKDPVGWSKDVWQKMGEYGWLGLTLPESIGGLGRSFIDAALILEQLGATLVPEPLIPSLIAAAPIAQLGTEEQKAKYLTPLAEGAISLALAYAETNGRFDPAHVGAHATHDGERYRIYGHKRWVLNGHAADHIVVSARTAGEPGDQAGISIFVLDKDTPGLTITPVKTMDGQHAAIIAFNGVIVDEDRLLGTEGEALAALESALDLGAAAACAEGAGICRTVLDMTVDYLKTREQFGVKIGTFQALQHRAVDMFVETELCKSTMILAALKVEEADENERKSAISAAKAQLAMSGRLVTQQAIQLHGGIGVTDEHDVGLYFKRMHVLNTLFGDEEYHVARYASLPSFEAGLEGP